MVKERYVFYFGDSHTLGSGDPEALGWAGRLTAAAAGRGIPITGYNLGVGGETSADVVARFGAELRPRLPAPDAGDPRVIFSFGANDTTLEGGAPRCDPERSCGHLTGALDLAADFRLGSFVVGPAAIDDDSQNDRIDRLSDLFRELCAERQVPYVEVSRHLRESNIWRNELRAGDGSHPGAAGYEELARLVLDAGWMDWLEFEIKVSE